MSDNYQGNPNLKKLGIPIEYTKEQILEIKKCSENPIYFIENYVYITTLDHGLKLFELYDCQKEKIELIHNNRKVIIMESRQAGKTTTAAAYILWYTVFQSDKNVAILANKEKTAREILSRYRLMYENLPIWMQHGVKTWNKGDVELENGSKVATAATTAMGIRSASINLLYIDEAAIIPNNIADAFFASVYPVVSAGTTTKILITSTPLGYNHFWKYWNDAVNGLNGFINLFIPYWKIPGRDAAWAEEQKRILGDVKFNQEILCLGGKETVTIRNKFTHKIETISLEKLYELLYGVRNNSTYEILAPSGWQDFEGVNKSKKNTLKIKFQSGTEVVCTPNHKFIHNNVEITAKTLRAKSKIGHEIVVSITLNGIQDVYDPINVANGNQYISKNIVSHNCTFLGSSYTLIRGDILGQLSYSPTILSDSGLDVYEYPIKKTIDDDHKIVTDDHVYIIIADTSKGVGNDYSAFTVIDISTIPYRIVAKYRDNKISPLVYPSVIYKIAKQYNNAFVLIEINSSEQVAHILYAEYEYEHILFVQKDNHGQTISHGFGRTNTLLGVSTDTKVKRIGCSNIKSLIEEKKLLIPDADIISELSTFVQVRNSYEADEGYNDDLAMTLVLFGWVATTQYFKELTDVNLRKMIYKERIEQIESDLLPILYDDGRGEKIIRDKNDIWIQFGEIDNSGQYTRH